MMVNEKGELSTYPVTVLGAGMSRIVDEFPDT